MSNLFAEHLFLPVPDLPPHDDRAIGLGQVNDGLNELLPYATSFAYTRNSTVSEEGAGLPLIQVLTEEKLRGANGPERYVRLVMPFEEGGADVYGSVWIMEGTQDESARLQYHIHPPIGAPAFLGRLLANPLMTPGMQHAVDLAAKSLTGFDRPTGSFDVPLDRAKFESAWAAMQDDMNTAREPTGYRMYYNGPSENPTTPLRIHALGSRLTTSEGGTTPEHLNQVDVTLLSKFEFNRSVRGQNVEESRFLDPNEAQLAGVLALAALSPEDRPYTVSSVTDEELALLSKDPTVWRPDRFAVMHILYIGDQIVPTRHYANTQEEAQLIADYFSLEELGPQHSNTTLTPERIQRVVGALNMALAIERR